MTIAETVKLEELTRLVAELLERVKKLEEAKKPGRPPKDNDARQ